MSSELDQAQLLEAAVSDAPSEEQSGDVGGI